MDSHNRRNLTSPHRLHHVKARRLGGKMLKQAEYQRQIENGDAVGVYAGRVALDAEDMHYSNSTNQAKLLHFKKIRQNMRESATPSVCFEKRMERMFNVRENAQIRVTTTGTVHTLHSRVISDDSHYPNLYYVLEQLGSGTFGSVFRAYDRNRDEIVALKFLNYNESCLEYVHAEVSLLQYQNNCEYTKHCTSPQLNFFPQNQLAVVVLPCYKYSLLGVQDTVREVGLPMDIIRHFTRQLLELQISFRKAGILHADLKPDNLMLDGDRIVSIDFGASVFENCPIRTYLQSRYYRAPEISLQCGYYYAIDTWSVACIVAEMFLGVPLFPAQSSYSHIARMCMQLGPPPDNLLMASAAGTKFFARRHRDDHFVVNSNAENSDFLLKSPSTFSKEYNVHFSSNDMLQFRPGWTLLDVLAGHRPQSVRIGNTQLVVDSPTVTERSMLSHFLQGLQRWDPDTRWAPEVALQHPFLTGSQNLTTFNALSAQTTFLAEQQEKMTTNSIHALLARLLMLHKSPERVNQLPEVEMPANVLQHFDAQIGAYRRNVRKKLTANLKKSAVDMVSEHKLINRYAQLKKLLDQPQSDPILGVDNCPVGGPARTSMDVNEASFDAENARMSLFCPSDVANQHLPKSTVKEEELQNPSDVVLLKPCYYQLRWKRSRDLTSIQLCRSLSLTAMPQQIQTAMRKLLSKHGVKSVRQSIDSMSASTLVQVIKLKLQEEQSQEHLLGAITLHIGELIANPLQTFSPHTDPARPPLPKKQKIEWLRTQQAVRNLDLVVTKVVRVSEANVGKLAALVRFKEKQLQNGKKARVLNERSKQFEFADSFTSSLFGQADVVVQPSPMIRPSTLALLQADQDRLTTNASLRDVKTAPRNHLLRTSVLMNAESPATPPSYRSSSSSSSSSCSSSSSSSNIRSTPSTPESPSTIIPRCTIIPTLKTGVTPASPSTSVIESFRKLHIQQVNQKKQTAKGLRMAPNRSRLHHLLESIAEDSSKSSNSSSGEFEALVNNTPK